jgi:hypothetical protein
MGFVPALDEKAQTVFVLDLESLPGGYGD